MAAVLITFNWLTQAWYFSFILTIERFKDSKKKKKKKWQKTDSLLLMLLQIPDETTKCYGIFRVSVFWPEASVAMAPLYEFLSFVQ